VFAGLALAVEVVFAGLAFEFIDEVFEFIGAVLVFIGAGVLTLTGVEAFIVVVLFAGLALLVFSAPPQAIPRAPRLRTAESTITFFIVVLRLLFSQRINFLAYREFRPIRHSRCLELFLFLGKR
jgi:hypothetical protein